MAKTLTAYISAFFNIKAAQQALFDAVRRPQDNVEEIERKAAILCWCIRGNSRAINSLKLTLLKDSGHPSGVLLRNNPHLIRSLCEGLDPSFLELAGPELLMNPSANKSFARFLLIFEGEVIFDTTNRPPPDDQPVKRLCYDLKQKFYDDAVTKEEVEALPALLERRGWYSERRRKSIAVLTRLALQIRLLGWYVKACSYGVLGLLFAPRVVFVAAVVTAVVFLAEIFVVSLLYYWAAAAMGTLAFCVFSLDIERNDGLFAWVNGLIWEKAGKDYQMAKHLYEVLKNSGLAPQPLDLQVGSEARQERVVSFRNTVYWLRDLENPEVVRRGQVNGFAVYRHRILQTAYGKPSDKWQAALDMLQWTIILYEYRKAKAQAPQEQRRLLNSTQSYNQYQDTYDQVKITRVIKAVLTTAGQYYPKAWGNEILGEFKTRLGKEDQAKFDELVEKQEEALQSTASLSTAAERIPLQVANEMAYGMT